MTMTKACHASARAGFPPRGRSAVGLKGTPLLTCALLMSPSWKEASNARFVARRGRADTSSVQSTASRSCSWVKPSADECPMPTGNHPQSQPLPRRLQAPLAHHVLSPATSKPRCSMRHSLAGVLALQTALPAHACCISHQHCGCLQRFSDCSKCGHHRCLAGAP